MAALPSHVDILRPLIGSPSVSSADPDYDQPNRAVIDHLASFAEDVGFRVSVEPLTLAPGKANLVATIGPPDQPGGIVLSGHSDTVPYDEGAWATDPFDLVTRQDDGALFGLGVADMKGFFPAALHAISQVGAGALKRPVVLVATADEESTMYGALQLVAEGRRLGRRAIIGEPTGLRPIRKHKGVMLERLAVEGRSGHASDPGLGRNAIEGMVRVLEALMRHREALAATERDSSFAVPELTMNFGRISGGDSANRICPRCELHVDIRVLPATDTEALHEQLREVMDGALLGTDLVGLLEPLAAGVPSFETPATSEFVRACEAVSGAASEAVMFGTEAPYFAQLGMDTVVLGPGSIDVAHQPNETLRVADLERASEIYAGLLHRYCVDVDP